MKKFVLAAIAAAALAASCNSGATAPTVPVASEEVVQYAQTMSANPSEGFGDVIYLADGTMILVEDLPELQGMLTRLSSNNELAKIDRIVERSDTPEYGAAVSDYYDWVAGTSATQ